MHRRDEQGRWQLEISAPDSELRLEALPNNPLTLTMDEIYEDMLFRPLLHSPHLTNE